MLSIKSSEVTSDLTAEKAMNDFNKKFNLAVHKMNQ